MTIGQRCVIVQNRQVSRGNHNQNVKRRIDMKAYERMLKYIVVRTPSDGESGTTPSSQCQFELADMLVEELKELGVENASVDEQCFVYGIVPATPGYEDKTKIGFIAHMDTVSEFCDHEIKPILTENYNGEDLPLGDSGRVLTVKDFPHLPSLKGRTLITSDGTTILGVDDKAGIAEIMTLIERLQEEKIPHGQISVAFTPDEEVGTGVSHFDIEKFGAEYAYTLDGDGEGEIQYQNFNACEATFEVRGFNVHPGAAKDVMINAVLVATEINSMLPGCETPRHTSGYEGFYHLLSIHGDEASAKVHYMLRDHDLHSFEARENTLRHIEKIMNEKWGEGTVTLTIKEQYRNMEGIIEGCMHLIENAREACKNANVPEDISPIRGGTDGCQLSFRGLPCPNLGTGGHGYHGPYEHATVEGIEKATDVIVELVKIYAK